MSIKTLKPTLIITLATLLLLLSTTSSFSIPKTTSSFQSLFSLSHSLLTRVANLRASRGDISGSVRLKSIADKIDKHSHGFSFYKVMWSLSWDYIKNYAWRDFGTASFGAVSDLNQLIRVLNELNSDGDRIDWVRRNYATLLNLSNSLFNRLLKIFTHPGPLKDVIETVRAEIVDGGLLRDCLELGSSDLKGLMQILKDVALKYPSSTSDKTEL
ncbi:uncharacterized protein [Rutidosis leptorrhynchoides]|uniref:uncharacterized protein n=1 Tax=Rutidosis leptorrhynchoides TaxID=125765 RepID=UPI003A991A39